MAREMRKKARVSYYEPEEPSFDEYVFCTRCGDYVYEYCSIHGPLLVIPDNKVPSPTGYPPFVPRAALTVPPVFLHLAPSTIPDAGIGVFSTLTLPRGVRFGPYRGLKAAEANSPYCWQLFDREHKPSHVLDARDPDRSNWMRYVNCARHCSEQNLAAFQYQRQLYYRTIRIIPRFTELLVFYGSEFASELNIDLSRYHSPVYTETLVKCADEESLADAMQPPDGTTVNMDDLQNLETQSNSESQYRHTSDSNSLIINLDSEGDETDVYSSRVQHEQSPKGQCSKIQHDQSPERQYGRVQQELSETQSLFNLDLNNENLKSNIPRTHESETYSETHINKNITHTNICSICNVKFNKKSDYINHDVKMHNSNIKYVACHKCDYKTVKSWCLKEHIERHSDIKQKCELCDYVTASSVDLRKHKHKHKHEAKTKSDQLESDLETQKSLSCTVCGNKYQRSYNLNRHLRTHKEKIHECMICNKGFGGGYELRRHMKVHNKQYICGICNKQFCESYGLERHMKSHTILTQNVC